MNAASNPDVLGKLEETREIASAKTFPFQIEDPLVPQRMRDSLKPWPRVQQASCCFNCTDDTGNPIQFIARVIKLEVLPTKPDNGSDDLIFIAKAFGQHEGKTIVGKFFTSAGEGGFFII